MIFFNKAKPVTTAGDNQGEPDVFTTAKLFLTWLQIGFTSFGGGATTQYLIQEKFIYQHKWITDEEYAGIIGMCQITPGINIFAYTILIGKKLAGALGIFVSLMGLVLPSAAITVAITTIYTSISKYTRVRSALQTMFAAVLGISLATSWRNVRPIVVKNYKRGPIAFGVTILTLAGSAAIYVIFKPSVILLYILGGLCCGVTYWLLSGKKA